MSLGSIESIGNAVHNYYFGGYNNTLSNNLAIGAVASGCSLVYAAVTYANAHIVGVEKPKGMVLGSIGLGFTMPIMSLVTAAAFRSNAFAGIAAAAMQLGVGVWSFKKASEWTEHPVTYTEMATTALLGAAEVVIPVSILLKR